MLQQMLRSNEKIHENPKIQPKPLLGGGFKHFLFPPLFGEMVQIDSYFSDGLKPPTRKPLGLVFLERHFFKL